MTKSLSCGRLVPIPVPRPSARTGAVLRPVRPGSQAAGHWSPCPLSCRPGRDTAVPAVCAVGPRVAYSWENRPVLVFVGRRVAEKGNNFFEQTKKLFN